MAIKPISIAGNEFKKTLGSLGAKPADFVLGSALQVQNNEADFSTLQGAVDAAINGETILVLNGIHTGNAIINKHITIFGEGNLSIIVGNITYATASSGSNMHYVRIDGIVTFDIGSTNCMINSCWLSLAGSVVDSGTNNTYTLWQEA